MYRVFWYGRNGGEHKEEAESITKACQCAMGVRYGFACIKDANGSIVFDGIAENDNGVIYFYKNYRRD